MVLFETLRTVPGPVALGPVLVANELPDEQRRCVAVEAGVADVQGGGIDSQNGGIRSEFIDRVAAGQKPGGSAARTDDRERVGHQNRAGRVVDDDVAEGQKQRIGSRGGVGRGKTFVEGAENVGADNETGFLTRETRVEGGRGPIRTHDVGIDVKRRRN
jgi:hypothetical protein